LISESKNIGRGYDLWKCSTRDSGAKPKTHKENRFYLSIAANLDDKRYERKRDAEVEFPSTGVTISILFRQLVRISVIYHL
jgi:hypothetical protein